MVDLQSVYNVTVIIDDEHSKETLSYIRWNILDVVRVNDVQKFRFSRPIHRKELSGGDGDNEFASLWLERTVLVTSYPLPGILRWFPVTSTDTYQVK